MAGILVLDLVAAVNIRVPDTVKPVSVWRNVLCLLVRPREALFVLWSLSCGILTSIIWQWHLWYLTDLASTKDEETNCSLETSPQSWVTTLLGLCMAVQCFAGEVPMFFLSGWVIRQFGHPHTMTLVLAVFGLRFLLYSFLSNPWHSLPIELLHGVTFGLCYSTMASYAHTISPPGMEATVQGIVGAAFEGVGVAIGSVVGGGVYESRGGVFLFRAFSIFSFILCIIHASLQAAIHRYCPGMRVPLSVTPPEEGNPPPSHLQELLPIQRGN